MISFRPGYYEYNVFIDDKIVYTFGDGCIEELSDVTSSGELVLWIDFMVDAMQSELSDNDKDTIPQEYILPLKEQMYMVWGSVLGIVEVA